MNTWILFVSFVAIVWGAPLQPGPNQQYAIIPIISQSQDVGLDGNFVWGFEAGNGITQQQQGIAKAIGPEEIDQTIQGEFKYTSPEGETVYQKYIADKDGFRILESSHLPTPPPIPPEILNSLKYNAAHPEEDEQYPTKLRQ